MCEQDPAGRMREATFTKAPWNRDLKRRRPTRLRVLPDVIDRVVDLIEGSLWSSTPCRSLLPCLVLVHVSE